jgi:hypothetical protein
MYNIKRGVTTIATVRPESGSQIKKIMGENQVDMVFTLNAPVDFAIGDWVEVFGENYTLNALPNLDKSSNNEYKYNCQFQGMQYELAKYNFMMLDSSNVPTEPDFSIMGNAETFIDLLVLNANRASSGWSKGDVDVTDIKSIAFSNANCMTALNQLAVEFENEFWIVGKVIHFTKKGVASGLTFEYGKGKGLYSFNRQNKEGASIVTRLYAYGSTQNLPSGYRNYSQRLKLPELTGNYIDQGVAEYGVIEGIQIFDDIKPERIGTVSGVNAGNVFEFTDSAMDFDVNAQLLPGVAVKVHFLTGLLAGYDFTVSSYNHTTKKFILNKNDNEKAIEIPGSVFKPAIGDTYFLFDLSMPSTYVTAAENKVQTRAEAYLAQNALSRVMYNGNIDPLHIKRNGITIVLGNSVIMKDTPLGINDAIRVIGLTRGIILDGIEQYRYTLDLSESVKPSNVVRSFAQLEKVKQAIQINDLLNPARARANWRSSQEMLQMVFDPDGQYYTDKIKPASIETLHIAAGARSQAFQTNVLFQPSYGGDDTHFVSSSGTLDHFSIDPSGVRSWTVAASNYTGLGSGAMYIYAKCAKVGSSGTILLSASQITVDQDSDYYHFLCGVLHAI